MLAAALTLALAFAPQQPADRLGAFLAHAVDKPTPALRREAADRLAREPGASVDDWLAACAAFGAFAARPRGQSEQTVDLHVDGEIEPTQVFLYTPRGYDPVVPAPLLLWGHGAGGSGHGHYQQWQREADELGMFVLCVTEFGDVAGWGSTPRERHAQLAALRWARRQANIDENAIFVGGVSRGGHMTWDLILRHPDRWAGALPVVGGPRMQLGSGNNLRYLENVVPLPIRDLQGSRDDPLLVLNLRIAFDRLAKWQAPDAVLHEFAEHGHSADYRAVDWLAFFGRRRDPRPERVVRVAAEPDEARSAWLEITGFDRRVAVDAAPRVDARRWQRLDERGQREWLLDELAERTARLAVEDRGGGRFDAESRHVTSFALWLAAEQIGPDGAVEVRCRGRTTKRRVEPDAAVLLHDFVERFDRTFLPVARVAVP